VSFSLSIYHIISFDYISSNLLILSIMFLSTHTILSLVLSQMEGI
jgi:hypothetical protein